MPLYNYGRTPGFAPGGRGISPETGRIGSLPGGMDFLAGLGPAPKGVTDWVDPAVIINRRLASVYPGENKQQVQTAGLQDWIRKIGNNPAAIAKLYPGKPGFATNTAIGMGFNPNAFAGTGGPGTPMMPGASGSNVPTPVQGPTPVFQGITTPNAATAGAAQGLSQQWNDQNDPGGFIRKWQQQQMGQINSGTWSPNLGSAGSMYFSPGQSSTRNVGG